MQEKKVKRLYRLPPCPSYDVEGMESWLSDMAEKGWILAEDGIFFGVATFEKGASTKMRYRLTAAKNGTSLWGENNGDPQSDEIEHSAMLGWEYIAKRGDFHIYRSADLSARELNTDPQVQAMALKELRKKQRVCVFDWIFWAVLYRAAIMKANFILSALHLKTWFALLLTFVVAWFVINSIIRTVHYGKLCKKLKENGRLDGEKDWKKSVLPYHGGRILRVILVFVIISISLANINAPVLGEEKIPLEQFEGDTPFATIADFAQGEYEIENYGSWSNNFVNWTDWLAPDCWRWWETAKVETADGTLDGGLYVDYYRASTPLIANLIAREYYRDAKWDKDCEIFEAQLPEADFAVAYYNEIHMPYLILQRGDVVIHVGFIQHGEEYKLTFEEWAAMVSENLK